MPLVRKRRAPRAEEESGSEDASTQTARAPQQRRGASSAAEESDGYVDPEVGTQVEGGPGQEQMVKNLIRFALACEYARQPIRKADVNAKVMGHNSRQFKTVFEEAQMQLRYTFGMEMTELPLKEKVTISQRRAAQKNEKTSTASNAWILTSTLPDKFRTPEIIPPPKVPTTELEAAYVGLYTFILSVIYLAGGQLPEAKLERYLKRANADQSTPVDKTDKLLNRLVKEGYIVRIKESMNGEESVEYRVGPRGKVEVGEEGVAGLVRTVYGDTATDDLEQRLERALGLTEHRQPPPPSQMAAAAGAKKGRGRPRRQTHEDEEVEEESDEDG